MASANRNFPRFNKPSWVIERYRRMTAEEKIVLVKQMRLTARELKAGLRRLENGRRADENN